MNKFFIFLFLISLTACGDPRQEPSTVLEAIDWQPSAFGRVDFPCRCRNNLPCRCPVIIKEE